MKIIFRLLFVSALFCLTFGITTSFAQKDTINSDMSFDFGFTRGRNINAWPILKINKSKEKKDIQILFSIYRLNADYILHTKHSHLFPLYFYDSTATNRDYRFFSLYYPSVFRYTNDNATSTRSFKFAELAPEINLLEFTRSADGLFVQNNFLFILWYKNNQRLHKSHLILFPVYWSFKNDERTSQTFLPLFTHGTYDRGQGSFLGVTPFFWHIQKHDITRNILFPLWWNKKTGEGDNVKYRNYVFPLYWSYRDKNSNRQTLFPIFWHKNEQRSHSLSVLPIFYYNKEKNVPRWQLMVTPLFWHNKQIDGYSNVLFPIWWNKKSGSGDNEKFSNVIFPIWWSYKEPGIRKHVLFPLIWSLKERDYSSFTFFPIFSYGHSSDNSRNQTVITPLFWHSKNPNGYSNVLFPLWFNNKHGIGNDEEYNNVIFPFYWSHRDYLKNNKILFPLAWSLKNKNYHSFTFAPLFSFGHSPDSIKNHLVITPLFWHIKNNLGYSNILFPLVWNSKKGVGENAIYQNYIFPVYYSYRDKFRSNYLLFPLFSYGHSFDSLRSHLIITPLFWKIKNKNEKYTVLFPLWWSRYQKAGNEERYFNVFFPLYWAQGDKNKSNKVLFPFFWNSKNRYYHSVTLAPLFSYGHSPDSAQYHLMITPIFWHVEKDKEKYNVLFPIWWSRKQGSGDSACYTNMIFPLFWSYSDKYKKKFTLFPIVWRRNDRYYKSFTFIPVVSWGHSPDSSRSHFMATPLFWHVKKKDEITNFLFPLWWYKKHGTGDNFHIINNVFPFYYSSVEKDRKYQIFIPIVWNFKDAFYKSFTLAPFVSYGNSPDSAKRHLMVTPLFWHIKNQDKYFNVLFPIWWNFKEGTGENITNTNVIFPLYWAQKSKNKNYQVLFPVIWNFKDKYYHSITIPPLFSYGSSPDTMRKHLMITPLFWHFKKDDQVTSTLFPLWWQRKKGYGENATGFDVFFPLYWAIKTEYEHNRILFPVIWSLKNQKYESFTIFPIISRGNSPDSIRNHWMLTPFFWHFQEFDNRLNVVFPIWWSKKEVIGNNAQYTDVLFPFYWSYQDKEKTNKILFPVIWSFKNTEYSSLTIAPIFSMGASADSMHRHLMITPLFWHTKNHNKISNVLFPIWWNQRKTIGDDQRVRNYIFPFYWAKCTKYSSTHILFPVLWQHKSEYKSSFTLFPIFSYGKSNTSNRGHLVITPLFWNIRKPESNTTTLIPLFYYKSDTSGNSSFNFLYFLYRSQTEQQKKSVSFIWPICEFSSDVNTKYFRFAPLVWYKKSLEKNYFSIMPFYYYSRNSESERTHILWQLFVAKHYFNVKKTRRILWKFVTWERYENKDREFRILHLLYANVNKEGNTEKSIFPFYYKTTEKNGSKSLSVFLGFYNSFKRQIQDTDEFYQEQRIFWVIRLRSNYKSLKERGLIQTPKQLK